MGELRLICATKITARSNLSGCRIFSGVLSMHRRNLAQPNNSRRLRAKARDVPHERGGNCKEAVKSRRQTDNYGGTQCERRADRQRDKHTQKMNV